MFRGYYNETLHFKTKFEYEKSEEKKEREGRREIDWGAVEIHWPRLCIPLLLNVSSSSEAGQASMRALERRV